MENFKRFIPSVILAALLVAAPVMYFWGPSVNGPFGVYDVTMPAIEDTYISTASVKFILGDFPFMRVGNVYDYGSFTGRTTNDTTLAFLRVPRPDMGANTSFSEVGMFKWLGVTNLQNPNGTFIVACPITLQWSQDTFNFVEFSLAVQGTPPPQLLPDDETIPLISAAGDEGGALFTSDGIFSSGLLCSSQFVPDGLIGWVYWNMTGIMGTNDTIMFMQFPWARNAYHIFDSTEGDRAPIMHVVYEGIGPDEKPLWIYGAYIAGVLIIGQVALWQIKKRRRAKLKRKGNIR